MSALGGVIPFGVLLAITGAFGLAGMSLGIRYGTVRTRSADALVVVLGVNILVLVPVAFVVADPFGALTVRSVAAFAAAGLVGTLIARALHFEGIKRVGSSRAEPLKSSQPLHATIIAVVVLGEMVSAGHAVALIAIVLGIALITYEHGRADTRVSGVSVSGLALPFAAAFFYGIEPTFAKLGFAAGAGVLPGLVVKTVAAAIGFLAYLWWTRGVPGPGDIARQEYPWLIGAGLANTWFLLAYYGALELEPVSVVVPLVQSSPLLVILVSILFVRDDLERVTWRLAIGAAVVVAGAIGVTVLG